MQGTTDSWSKGSPYDQFMGRWSSLISRKFLAWLNAPAGQSWVDLGCGTGALSRNILDTQTPKDVLGIDSSAAFISFAEQTIADPRIRFRVGLAQHLDIESQTIHVVVSGLMLNFVPQPLEAAAEMMRVTRPGGRIGVFLWDYSERMEMLRYFWDAAIALDDQARAYDEGIRFPLCREGALEALVHEAGLKNIRATSIEATTIFRNFSDYWTPFLGGVGPAPGYVSSLREKARLQLEARLRETLPIDEDGSIKLTARAWAVKGTA